MIYYCKIILRSFFKQSSRTNARERVLYIITDTVLYAVLFSLTISHKALLMHCRDSVLLKTGNWMKKIEVKRALKSDDISINLISSDYGKLINVLVI